MKALKIILIITGLLFYSNVDNDVKVYVNKNETKYHKKECKLLLKSHAETTLEKAKSKGFSACNVCGTKEDVKSKASAKKPTFKKITKKEASNTSTTAIKYCSSVKKNGKVCRRKTRNPSGRCKAHS